MTRPNSSRRDLQRRPQAQTDRPIARDLARDAGTLRGSVRLRSEGEFVS